MSYTLEEHVKLHNCGIRSSPVVFRFHVGLFPGFSGFKKGRHPDLRPPRQIASLLADGRQLVEHHLRGSPSSGVAYGGPYRV